MQHQDRQQLLSVDERCHTRFDLIDGLSNGWQAACPTSSNCLMLELAGNGNV
jgi:hypothetical protein